MPITARRRVTRIAENSRETRFDSLMAEEPLEIRIDGRSWSWRRRAGAATAGDRPFVTASSCGLCGRTSIDAQECA